MAPLSQEFEPPTNPGRFTIVEVPAPPASKPVLRIVASRDPIALPAPTTGKFAAWLETLPAGTEISGTQRELANKAGVALSAAQRGLDRARRAGTIHMVVSDGAMKVVKAG